MPPALSIACESAPDLEATMQLQIPALAWHPAEEGGWQRIVHLHGRGIPVRVEADGGGLHFHYRAGAERGVLRALLTATFRNGAQVGGLTLDGHPALRALRRHHEGMILLSGSPFETLVLAILAQARPADAVRKVFPRLAAACGGITPQRLAALPLPRLAQLVSLVGEAKAARLHATAAILDRRGETAFDRLFGTSGSHALAFLMSLPGVATHTAAIVTTIINDVPDTMPIDQSLMRVAYRLGLTDHDGGLTKPGIRRVTADLLAYGPGLARAYPLLQQVALDTCTVGVPDCRRCFLADSCRHAADAKAF
ncbi:endonuclease III domain-containing protein [Dactylosporangium sp. NPDC048998]|uniref:endonuclease III domain-containing protein n=1 Tax=Dactylosporangium sp. NPDC048998 TaxID=3363976 RepID=UPI003715206F